MYDPDKDDSFRKQMLFLLFVCLGALAFGLWQKDIYAGCFMFFALYLIAP